MPNIYSLTRINVCERHVMDELILNQNQILCMLKNRTYNIYTCMSKNNRYIRKPSKNKWILQSINLKYINDMNKWIS